MEARRGRDAAGGLMRYAHDSATGHLSGGRGRPDLNAEETTRSGQAHARHRGSKHQHDRAISQVKGTSKAAPNRPMLQR